eukprot:5743551-Pyramimonas_sp.AAC.2
MGGNAGVGQARCGVRATLCHGRIFRAMARPGVALEQPHVMGGAEGGGPARCGARYSDFDTLLACPPAP